MKKFPKNFDKLSSDFARAALNLPLPDDLSKPVNKNRWALYVSSLDLCQLIDSFANGLDELNPQLNNAPYVFDFASEHEGRKAKIYSNILASEQLAKEVCKRLNVDGAYSDIRPAERIFKACEALIKFDDDEELRRKEWVERYAKSSLLKQNKSLVDLEEKMEAKPKLFKRMARFI